MRAQDYQCHVGSIRQAAGVRIRVHSALMDEPLNEQIRYLELRLAECLARPLMHTRQIAAYRQQVALASAESTGLGYLRSMVETGTTMEITRAEWLDRYRNWAEIYRALGDEVRVGTAQANWQAAESAGAGPELMSALLHVKGQSSLREHASDANLSCLHSLVATLLEWRVVEAKPYRREYARTCTALWTTMQRNDPGCTWQRLCEYPPYRSRLPFARPQLRVLGSWLEQIVGPMAHSSGASPVAESVERTSDGSNPSASSNTVPPEPTELIMAVPSARQAASAYHLTYQSLDGTDPANHELCRLYQRIFELEAEAESGPAFLRAMAEADLYCQLARVPQLALSRRGLARSSGRSQPHAEHHFGALEQALLACRSPTEIEYEVERASRMFAVEVTWNDILLAFLARPVAAICSYVAEPDELRRNVVVASYRVVEELFGRGWQGMWAVPRLWDMFCKVWFAESRPSAVADPSQWGGHLGELGTAMVARVREAALQRVMEKSAFETPEDMLAYLGQGLRWALGVEIETPLGVGTDRDLILWGQPVDLEQLHVRLRAPGRPMIELSR